MKNAVNFSPKVAMSVVAIFLALSVLSVYPGFKWYLAVNAHFNNEIGWEGFGIFYVALVLGIGVIISLWLLLSHRLRPAMVWSILTFLAVMIMYAGLIFAGPRERSISTPVQMSGMLISKTPHQNLSWEGADAYLVGDYIGVGGKINPASVIANSKNIIPVKFAKSISAGWLTSVIDKYQPVTMTVSYRYRSFTHDTGVYLLATSAANK